MKQKLLLGAALIVGMLGAAGAQADTITIGLQQSGVNGGAITTVGSGSGSFSISNYSYGSFVVNNSNGTGSPYRPEGTLDSNSITTSSTGAGTLNIFITASGLSLPAGSTLASILSSFTENILSGPITSVTETTFIDNGNGLFGGTQIATQTFTGLGSIDYVSMFTPSSMFSITEEYTITASAAGGGANSTIRMAMSVPEPASLGLLGLGLLGAAGFTRRRRA